MLVESPFEQFFELSGQPLNNGFIYIGVAGLDPQTNPQAVYADAALTIPISQPIRTTAGVPYTSGSPTRIYTADSYSIRVRNIAGAQVFYRANSDILDLSHGSQLSTITSPVNGQAAFVTTAGKEGWFIFSSANLSALVSVDTTHAVYIAPASAPSGASGAWVRQHDGWLQAEWFGAKGDFNGTTGTDNLATFNAITAFLNATGIIPESGRRGAYGVRLGLGVFYCSDVWDVKGSTFILEGVGTGQQGGRCTMIVFASGKGGLRLQTYNTQGGGVGSTIPYGNDATVIRNFALRSLGGSGSTAHGVWARCRFESHSVYIDNFPAHGYNINATAGGGGAAEGNANSWMIVGGRVEECDGDGLHVEGGDVNAGSCVGTDFSFNGGWGVYDNSFLGNHYAGCHTAGNTLGAYTGVGVSSITVFLNCYSESGQPTSVMSQGNMCIGGLHGAGVTGVYVRARFGRFLALGGMVAEKLVGGVTTTVTFGDDPASGKAFTAEQSNVTGIFWNGFAGQDFYTGWTGTAAIRLTGPATAYQFGTGSPQPNVAIVDTLVVGQAGLRQWSAGGPWSTGTHQKGEIVWNVNPGAGGKIGWVCTTAGSPGTWKPFGAIDP